VCSSDLGTIDIYAPSTISWGPTAHLHRHVGGSEQAVIHLAPLLADMGYRVTVYASELDRTAYHHGVRWHHAGEFSPYTPRDVLFVWRQAGALRGCKAAAKGRWPVLLWAHDVPSPETVEAASMFSDLTLCVSQYHAGLFGEGSRSLAIQNGIDVEGLPQVLEHVRHPHRMIYASSLDRGLLHLLRMWPKVLSAYPEAELHVCYRSDLLLQHAPASWRRAAIEMIRLMDNLPRVTYHGGLPHDRMLRIMAGCGVLAYPSTFDEVSCIVAMEAQALGVWPVTTSRAALKETVLVGPMLDPDVLEQELGAEDQDGMKYSPPGASSPSYLDLLFDVLSDPPSSEDRANLVVQARRRYAWSVAASQISHAIEELQHVPGAGRPTPDRPDRLP
jgi:glycosyltransferase involved in cell wall biosynthesis